ncbi:hypothetical protein [Clostridium sp. C2-6-12]|uniref:hypothetical protein n=1 Tax=Clostridium sp. C2-6-12 TaxID=2698832 RepID=UPI001368D6B7|nr:hypothetical protein [Clostridium sp. C2-6-12]
MKIIGDMNKDMWGEFRKAEGKEEKKRILDKMINSHQERPQQSNVNLTPNQMEMQKQQDKLYMESIASKIARGEYVNDEEIKHLEKNDPILLSKSRFMDTERKRIENQVRNSRTKREAQNILSSARQGGIYLAFTGYSKGYDGGAGGMTFVSALNKAEDNTASDLRKIEKKENERELERTRAKKKINKLV